MRLPSGTRLFAFVPLAALVAVPAGSIVYDVPTDAELVARSPLIVYGRVQYTAPAPDGNFTDATVRIERVLKGVSPGSTVVVRQEGGPGVVVMGLPMLRKGDRALLFLRPGQGGAYRTVDMGLGIFFADRGHLFRHDVPEDGFRHAERFGRWIEDRETGLARPADYRVKEIPGPRPVRQEANWLMSRGDPSTLCGEGGPGTARQYMRWAQWDDGFSRMKGRDELGETYYLEPELATKVTVTAGGWTSEQALTMTDTAAAMWNSDSGSRVGIPAARINSPWGDQTKYIQAYIGVEYGKDFGGDYGRERVTYDWNGNKRLFRDKRTHNGETVFVVLFEQTGIDNHGAGNVYRCLKWGQTDEGDTNAGDALCPTHEGPYTPQGEVTQWTREVYYPSSILASTGVRAACHRVGGPGADGVIPLWPLSHSIPGGGGQAYRIGEAEVRISERAMENTATIQTLVARELGHALGIAHSAPGVEAVMSATVNVSYTSLQPDDRIAVRKLYPAVTGGSSPPSGGGGAPPPEPEPDEPPPPPPPVPPVASFTVDMPCANGLCSARTGEDVTFTDTSSGTVARRSWDFETGGRTPSGRSVTHAWPSPGFYRATLTVAGAGAESTASRTFRVDAASPAGSCVPGPETACLQDSRYEIEVGWRDGAGGAGAGRVVHAGTNDSGLFSFFDHSNWEVLIKVLDGCAANGHVWVFGGSTTDLGYVIRVTDTATGVVKEYRNEPGSPAAAITDVAAFPDGCDR
ncbi:MAG: PKD domain-containing protein [Holophagales bacterium]|nr:PKD domain-containing protein [Holophagales bacterium]